MISKKQTHEITKRKDTKSPFHLSNVVRSHQYASYHLAVHISVHWLLCFTFSCSWATGLANEVKRRAVKTLEVEGV